MRLNIKRLSSSEHKRIWEAALVQNLIITNKITKLKIKSTEIIFTSSACKEGFQQIAADLKNKINQ